MMTLTKKDEKNLTEGPFLGKLIAFTIPMILTALLQTAYNAADVAVVGFFRGQEALAAVGSTGSLFNVIVNLFMGLSVGAGVLVAKSCTARCSWRYCSEFLFPCLAFFWRPSFFV